MIKTMISMTSYMMYILSMILIVCTSCKMSYNVLSHSHWGLGQFFGEGRGAVSEKKTVPRF